MSMNKTIKLALSCCALALGLPNVRASEEALQTTEENQDSAVKNLAEAAEKMKSVQAFLVGCLNNKTPVDVTKIKEQMSKIGTNFREIAHSLATLQSEGTPSSQQPVPTNPTVPSAAVDLTPQDVQTRVRALQADIESLCKTIGEVRRNPNYRNFEGKTDWQTYRRIYYHDGRGSKFSSYELRSLTFEGLKAFQNFLPNVQEACQKIVKLFQDLRGQEISYNPETYRGIYEQLNELSFILKDARGLLSGFPAG